MKYIDILTEEQRDLAETLVTRLQAANPNEIWSIIDAIGWGTITTDNDLIKAALSRVYSERKIESIGAMARRLRGKLTSRVRSYEHEHQIENLFNVGDDGFWDVTAHIVGLGKEAYDKAMKDPSTFVELNYEENFEYSFQD